MTKSRTVSPIRRLFHFLLVLLGAILLTLAFFILLPVMQTINKPITTDMVLQSVDTANVPPPPPPPQEEPEEEPEPEEAPPELSEEAPPLGLDQLELALNPGFSEGWGGGDFTVNLKTVASESTDVDALFSIADLDQQPRAIYQPGPRITKQMRKKAPGQVYIIFVVDKQGKVVNPIVQKSTDPVFVTPALNAIKQWKFEPGKRNGQPVRFRMRVPITFPKG
ncbi:MAG: energy transducer TonB [Sedimentisphaeraceae bacterium JB056]